MADLKWPNFLACSKQMNLAVVGATYGSLLHELPATDEKPQHWKANCFPLQIRTEICKVISLALKKRRGKNRDNYLYNSGEKSAAMKMGKSLQMFIIINEKLLNCWNASRLLLTSNRKVGQAEAKRMKDTR